ncbi:MAG: NAD(P)/FAD-dependent oxidoreductase [Fimbriimonadaceae bacterium]|nr:NAD(P)/FAD-dependent oxidoreductase [Fimbriimonadaceae bacterium]
MNPVDVTVIGGGPCGLFASFYAGLRGMSVRIVDSLPELGGQLTALYPEKYVYDMPGFPKVLAKDLARQMIAQGTQFQPEVRLGETARALHGEPGDYAVETEAGHFATRTVIISAGAGAFSPTRLGAEREAEFEGHGLTYGVRHKEALRGKRVAIIGGGDSAFDWALNLLDTAASITLVHRRDGFKAHEETVAQVRDSAVDLKLWYAAKAILGDPATGIEGLELEHTQTKARETFACDAVVVNVGFKSSLGPIKEWGLAMDRNQIVVNDQMETSRPGVFAIGDVATFGSKLKLIATGVGEAATAVCFAKTRLDPEAKLFPGHSSDRDL